jgi:hypothetical protein
LFCETLKTQQKNVAGVAEKRFIKSLTVNSHLPVEIINYSILLCPLFPVSPLMNTNAVE